MSIHKIFAALTVFSLFAASAAYAGPKSNDLTVAQTDNAPASSALQNMRRESPIVMGRSVSVHHRSKLHHIKVQPIVPGEAQ